MAVLVAAKAPELPVGGDGERVRVATCDSGDVAWDEVGNNLGDKDVVARAMTEPPKVAPAYVRGGQSFSMVACTAPSPAVYMALAAADSHGVFCTAVDAADRLVVEACHCLRHVSFVGVAVTELAVLAASPCHDGAVACANEEGA